MVFVLELLLMTVATEKTDAFLRYIRSAEINKLKGKVRYAHYD